MYAYFDKIPVVDVFAGPGGLGEGFAGHRSGRFEVGLSAEMESSAHSTLRLRAYMRALGGIEAQRRFYVPLLERIGRRFTRDMVPPNTAAQDAWRHAEQEALQLTLGVDQDDQILHARVAAISKRYPNWVLVGGPPCQAYSLIGRARNKGITDYAFESDARIFLYRHYRGLIEKFAPAVFIMENVKGLLSARLEDGSMFQRIRDDLHAITTDGGRYRLFSLVTGAADTAMEPSEFLVKAEDHGVPQARHRVLLLGVREDVLRLGAQPGTLQTLEPVSLQDALWGIPPLRSTLTSRGVLNRDAGEWRRVIDEQLALVERACRHDSNLGDIAEAISALRRPTGAPELPFTSNTLDRSRPDPLPGPLSEWLRIDGLDRLMNHQARGHKDSDLGRYAFTATFRNARGKSPKSGEFPQLLAPDHRNWESGKFSDRFYAQPAGSPSSTITSHIAKDGHHFIHWDPMQCRAMTVREAARAQTFPDDYVFVGSRTEQFTQVGNAVPSFLSTQIAEIVLNLLSAVPALSGPQLDVELEREKTRKSFRREGVESAVASPKVIRGRS